MRVSDNTEKIKGIKLFIVISLFTASLCIILLLIFTGVYRRDRQADLAYRIVLNEQLQVLLSESEEERLLSELLGEFTAYKTVGLQDALQDDPSLEHLLDERINLLRSELARLDAARQRDTAALEARILALPEANRETGRNLVERINLLDAARQRDAAALEARILALPEANRETGRNLVERIDLLEAVLEARLAALEDSLGETGRTPEDLLAGEYAYFGQVSQESGEYGEAVEYYRNSLSYKPNPDTLMAYAESLYRADPAVRDDQEIINSLQAVLVIDPIRQEALSLLGTIFTERGELEEAEEVYACLGQIDPENAEVQRNLGRIALSEGRPEDAVAPLERAVRLNMEDPMAPYELGKAYVSLERHQEAAAAFSLSLERVPNYPPSLFGRAESRLVLGDASGSADDARLYVAVRRGDFRGHMVLGDAYAAQGKSGYALGAWDDALEALNLNSEADRLRWAVITLRQADLSRERGKTRDCLRYALRGLELSNDADLLLNALMASRDLGDMEAAAEYRRRLEKDYPESAQALAAERLLESQEGEV